MEPPLVSTSQAGGLMEVLSSFGKDGDQKRWSSFIGIVTAICGNVLISFALNVQKYAHIRLARERERIRLLQRKSKLDKKRKYGSRGGASVLAGSGEVHRISEVSEGRRASSRDGSRSRTGPGARGGSSSNGNFQPNYARPSSQASHHSKLGALKDVYIDDEGHTPAYLRSRWWWFGIILMTLGECGNFLAYGFAPASIVSPIGVVALISNCIIAPLMLKEPFRARDALGVIVAIAGVVIVVMSSNPEEVKFDPDQILHAISQTAFEVYFGVTCGLIVLLMYLSRKHGSDLILIDLGLVGLFGGYTALSTKGLSSLLSANLYKIITYPITYLLVFVLVSTAIMQIRYLNRSLQRFDSTQVIPVQFVLFTLSVIVGSAILYRDFERADSNQVEKFVTGCFLTFVGVYFITSRRKGRADHLFGDEESTTFAERYVDIPEDGQERRALIDGERMPSLHLVDDVMSDSNEYFERRPSSHRASHGNSTPPEFPRPGGTSRIAQMALPDRSIPSSIPPSPPSREFEFSQGRSWSTPVVGPTEASALLPRASTPTRNNSIDANVFSTTPTNSSLGRRSILIPGPLFAGHQLQAVVADTLRRGVDSIALKSPTAIGNDNEDEGENDGSSLTQTIRKKLSIRKSRSHGYGFHNSRDASQSDSAPQSGIGSYAGDRQPRGERRGTVGSAEGVANRQQEHHRRRQNEEEVSETSASEASSTKHKMKKKLAKLLPGVGTGEGSSSRYRPSGDDDTNFPYTPV